MKKIYLASPFFNEKEVEIMENVLRILRSKGLEVFAPYEHQNKHLEFGSLEWREATFNGDMEGIYNADIVVAILDGNMMDSGTAYECGIAFENKIPLVCVNIEKKAINLMIAQSIHAILSSYEELEAYDFNKLEKIKYESYVW